MPYSPVPDAAAWTAVLTTAHTTAAVQYISADVEHAEHIKTHPVPQLSVPGAAAKTATPCCCALLQQALDHTTHIEAHQVPVGLPAADKHHWRTAGIHHAQRSADLVVNRVELCQHDAVNNLTLAAAICADTRGRNSNKLSAPCISSMRQTWSTQCRQ